jgi:Pentapeptide repeats (8 copies)
MEIRELLERYERGQRDFTWVELNGALLAKMTLAGIGLSRAKLNGATLEAADLSRSKLIKAELENANLQQANLMAAILVKANLTGANLQRSHLKNTDLSQAQLEGANLTDANLEGANFTGANLTEARLTGANLTGIKLNRAKLTGANLEGAIWEGVDWTEADLTAATMPDGSLYEVWIESNLPESEPNFLPETETPSEDLLPKLLWVPKVLNLEGYQQKLFEFRSGLSPQEFHRQFPWKGVLPSAVGYFLLGNALALCDASLGAWLLGFIGAVGWSIDPSLTWFAPIVGAIAVLISLPISIAHWVIAAVAIIYTISLFFNLSFYGYGMRKSIVWSIWIGGLSTLFLFLMNALFAPGFITVSVFLSAFTSTIFIGIGCPSWIGMGYLGYSKQQTLQSTAIVAFLGLVLGAFCMLVSQ